MNIVKVTSLNEDGSIAFEGFFPPDEARLVLEVGVNILLANGMLAGADGDEEETEEFLDAMSEMDKKKLQ